MECCILLCNNNNFDHFLLNRNDQYPRIFDNHEDAEEYIWQNGLNGSVIIGYYLAEPMIWLLNEARHELYNCFLNYKSIKVDLFTSS